MLKLRNVCKYYEVGKDKKIVLDNVNIDFKKKELVFILGASGSGKSTLLNIIGGNLKCDSGDIFLDNTLVSEFRERELNNYRSSIIGNIFQDYNLIDYMSVWDNIMLGAFGNVSKEKMDVLLKQLGIDDKKKVIVNKLSGGEKQRVAIARAMVNDPAVILADEPTGALDSVNSIQVMEILKRISKNKLVIVVSHDNYLANKYADRIINIKDGKCEYYQQVDNEKMGLVKKGKIRALSIIKMAFKNLWIKKFRTLFTSLAITLGFISMAVVLCLSIGFNKEIDLLEERVVSVFPISINNGDYEIIDGDIDKSDSKIIIKDKNEWIHTNYINQEYIDYLNEIDEIKYMTYKYEISMPIVSDKYEMIDNEYFEIVPSDEFIDENYNILYGRNIENDNEILLKIDSNNNVSGDILNKFKIYEDIDYSEIVGRRVRIVLNDLYYDKNGEYYLVNDDNKYLYDNSLIELSIVGVIQEKEIVDDSSKIFYSSKIIESVLAINSKSEIVKSQINSDKNVFGLSIDKEIMLSYLGYNSLPSGINIYVDSISDKDKVIEKLDSYNDNCLEKDEIIYVDTMADAIEIVKNFVSIISVILIIFSMIAIVISSLMIGILTNIRVLERKKEIGILRSLGVSRRNIMRLFDIENMLIGMISFLLGLGIILILKDFINQVLNNLLEIGDIFTIDWKVMLGLGIFNIIIIKIAGSIPSRKASKLEIVNCIYDR